MPDQNDAPLTPAATPPEEAKNTVPAAENLIPQSRLNEVITDRNVLKAERDALKAMIEKQAKDTQAAETKRLEEQNQYKLLYETAANKTSELEAQLGGLTEKVTAAEAALLKVWEAKKGIIPKAMASLVDKLPLTERLEWLAENESELTKPSQGTPQHAPPNGSGKKAYDFGSMSVPSF